uniref:Trafficking protein particle complex subunit 13 n=1 Tax=Syphacia muris TaxID=451379 RepID=A0A0N5AHI4_9BILA
MSDTLRDQLLSLKVMRLARPKFHENTCVPVDPMDSMSSLIGSAVCKMTGQKEADIPVSEYLMVPQVFDNLYLGETFTFYICVQNESTQKATEICVKIDLQTTNQRITLAPTMEEANATLSSGEHLGQIVSHEIKEVGQHMELSPCYRLVCAVTYKTPGDDKMFFRKYFKFPVLKPIDVKTKFYNAENNDVYLEAQIQNTSELPMVLEKIVLEPSDFYLASEVLPSVNEKDDDREQRYLNQSDIRQFLYCLKPNIADYSLNYYKGGTSIGKLDMIWRTTMGERGHLQTSSLQRIVSLSFFDAFILFLAPGYGDIRLTVEKIPAVVKLKEVFEVSCKLHNCSERSLDLILTLDGSLQPNLIFTCVSGVRLGQLRPNVVVDFSFQLLPIQAGLQSISGIRVTDTFLKRTYEHDEIGQVLVV